MMWKICQYEFLMPHSRQQSVTASLFFFFLRFCCSLMVPALVNHYLSLQTPKQQDPLCLHPQSSQEASRIWKEMVGKTAVCPSVGLFVLWGSLLETFSERAVSYFVYFEYVTYFEYQSQKCWVRLKSFRATAISEPEESNLTWHAQKGECKNRAYNRQHSTVNLLWRSSRSTCVER